MDLGSLIGVFGSFAIVVVGTVMGGGSIVAVLNFPSFLIVIVGSYLTLMTAASISDALGVIGIIGRTFKMPVYNEQSIIQKMMAFSVKARREGLLALEDELDDLDDEFMKTGLRLMVDGTDASVIRDLMELELSQMQARHADKIAVVNNWATLAPGLGMLGTVIGLIGMLRNLEDKAAIGPNMAVALITTLYGSLVANLLMIPWAAKLKRQDAKETVIKEMIIEGVLSIQAGENTRILALKLLAYLNPALRKTLESELVKD